VHEGNSDIYYLESLTCWKPLQTMDHSPVSVNYDSPFSCRVYTVRKSRRWRGRVHAVVQSIFVSGLAPGYPYG